ncbi:MAG: protoporphyrinogen oxidase [Acidimicrobiia bacterium]|nr:protoporphyrinogen oxidase [Acidimicrobiia bacterium]
MSGRRVAVVGAGITGLAAAYDLVQSGAVDEVVVFESSGRCGGKIRTSEVAGTMVDEGADAFLARVPWATQLCRDIGLGGELTSPTSGAYIYSRAQLRRLPGDLVMGVPSDVIGVARSGVLSPLGVGRAALEPLFGWWAQRHPTDSVGAMVRRRYGREVLERLVDPLLGGIYAGDADRLSVAAAVPQLAAADRHFSMTLALRKAKQPASNGAPAPVFYSARGGMAQITDTLARHLAPHIRLNSPVTTVGPGGRVNDESFDAVILAAPANVAASMLDAPETVALLRSIELASVAVATLAIDDKDLATPLEGTGFLIPRPERRLLTACSWFSSKWPDSKPAGCTLLRASVGSIDRPADSLIDDDSLVAGVLSDLERLMGLKASPTEVRISRWPQSFPQYRPGHLDRVADIERHLAMELPEVRLAGAAYRGIGVAACVRQGREAAAAVLERWRVSA